MAAMYGGIWKEAWRVWPWLREPSDKVGWNWLERIANKFDFEVMKRKTLTLDQLIDWVRSVEPEDTPQPTETLVATEAHAEVVNGDS
jgi:hypothetical protein